jgi:hypothetical protein
VAESFTVTTMVRVPLTVGVPAIVPVEVRVRPAGRLPPGTDQM